MHMNHRGECFFTCTRHLSRDFERSREKSSTHDIHLRRADVYPHERICCSGYVCLINDDATRIFFSSKISVWYPCIYDPISSWGESITAHKTGHLNLSETSGETCFWITNRVWFLGILNKDMSKIHSFKTIIREFFYQIEITDSWFSQFCIVCWENRRELHRSRKSSPRSVIESECRVLPIGYIFVWERLIKYRICLGTRESISFYTCLTLCPALYTAVIHIRTTGIIPISIVWFSRIGPAIVPQRFLIAEDSAIEIFFVVDGASRANERREFLIEIK